MRVFYKIASQKPNKGVKMLEIEEYARILV
jgi:hypothetical protein